MFFILERSYLSFQAKYLFLMLTHFSVFKIASEPNLKVKSRLKAKVAEHRAIGSPLLHRPRDRIGNKLHRSQTCKSCYHYNLLHSFTIYFCFSPIYSFLCFLNLYPNNGGIFLTTWLKNYYIVDTMLLETLFWLVFLYSLSHSKLFFIFVLHSISIVLNLLFQWKQVATKIWIDQIQDHQHSACQHLLVER